MKPTFRSLQHEGWRLVKDPIGRGRYSGAHPLSAPQSRVCWPTSGPVQVVGVYKLDRLSRSLNVFGRLMLNVLLSFEQLECEVARGGNFGLTSGCRRRSQRGSLLPGKGNHHFPCHSLNIA